MESLVQDVRYKRAATRLGTLRGRGLTADCNDIWLQLSPIITHIMYCSSWTWPQRRMSGNSCIMTNHSLWGKLLLTPVMRVEKVKVSLFRLLRKGLPRLSGKGRSRLQRLVWVEVARNRRWKELG